MRSATAPIHERERVIAMASPLLRRDIGERGARQGGGCRRDPVSTARQTMTERPGREPTAEELALDRLTGREREVLCLRLGIGTSGPDLRRGLMEVG
jgi:hypothetical protein